MSIPFSCPHCDLETLVDADFAGQSGPCAGCGRAITVPMVADSHDLLESGEVVVGIPHRRKSAFMIVMLVLGSVVAGGATLALLVTLLTPAFTAARAAAHQHSCTSNLERIAEALFQYEAEHGSFPPAYVADSTGRPIHSWRVLLLPYLDESGLDAQYDMHQPWDSPTNLALAKSMPAVFACSADPDARALGESSYMVVVGPRTLFPGKQSVSMSSIVDDMSTTLAVVEARTNGVPWIQPVDLSVKKMQFVVNGQFGNEIGSHHIDGANVLMADGTVRFLTELLSADYLSGMSTIDGDEFIPDAVLAERDSW